MRFLLSFAVGLLIILAGVVYTLSQPKIYEAKGVIQVKQSIEPLRSGRVSEPTIEQRVALLESVSMILGILERLGDAERERLCPSSRSNLDNGELSRSLASGRFIREIPNTRLIEVVFRHTDSEIAAIVVNEFIRGLFEYEVKINLGGFSDPSLSLHYVESKAENLKLKIQSIERLGIDASEADILMLQDLNMQLLDVLSRIETLHREIENDMMIDNTLKLIQSNVSLEELVKYMDPFGIRVSELARIPENHNSPNIPLQIILSFIAGILGGALCFKLLNLRKREAE